jgi:hypothetical protein
MLVVRLRSLKVLALLRYVYGGVFGTLHLRYALHSIATSFINSGNELGCLEG